MEIDAGYAPLDDWIADPERPGYYYHPDAPTYRRDARGHWYSRAALDQLRGEVDSADVEASARARSRFRQAIRARSEQP